MESPIKKFEEKKEENAEEAVKDILQEESNIDNTSREKSGKYEVLFRKFLSGRPNWVVTSYIISLGVFISTIPAAYYLWFYAIPYIYSVAVNNYWHWLWAWLAVFFLAFIPVYIVMFGVWLIQILLTITVDKTVEKAFDPVREAEADLSEGDDAQLLPLLKYSRSQLEAYYKISLKQTRRSFLFSVIAMWVGFILILAGISVYFLPVEKLGLVRPDQDMKIVVIAGGAIIEFVSALFLWVYRSTTQQLTYFYNRQIHTHNVILCFRIANTMKESDSAKRSIIDKMLDTKWGLDQPPPVGEKWIGDLINPTKKSSA